LFCFPATCLIFISEGMEEATDEEIAHMCRKESEQISEVLESIPHLRKPSDAIQLNTEVSELDLSELVALRSAHETEQARKGVRGSTGIREGTLKTLSNLSQGIGLSRSGGAWQEIVRKFYQLLQDADAEGERVGTGLHRSHVWSEGNGNALNAAKVAEGRTKAVRTLSHLISDFNPVYLTYSQANDKKEVDLQRC
jgi:hypothetical protein